MSAQTGDDGNRGVGRRRLLLLIPLIAFLALFAIFLIGLFSGDPSRIPSALIGQPAPKTALPGVAGLDRDGKPVPGIDPADFKGAVTVLNVWASWCVPCHDEAPLLLQLSQDQRLRVRQEFRVALAPQPLVDVDVLFERESRVQCRLDPLRTMGVDGLLDLPGVARRVFDDVFAHLLLAAPEQQVVA